MKKLQTAVAVLAFVASAAAIGAPMSSSVPGAGTLRNDNAGGAGFSTVKVTGFNGKAGEFVGYFYPGPFAADSFFRFFCAEIGQSAVASATYTASIWTNQELKRLFDVAFPNKSIGDFWIGGITNFGVFSSADAAAAFQLALWELMFDPGDHDVSGGVFHVIAGSPPGITALAQSWIDSLGGSATWQNWTLVRFTSQTRQDYVTGLYKVPEPATLALLAGGLLLLVWAQRRRR